MRALRIACLLVFCLLLSLATCAQQAPPASTHTAAAAPAPGSAAPPPAAEPPKPDGPLPAPEVPADLQQVVTKQFGPNFKVAAQRVMKRRYLNEDQDRAIWLPFMLGDLDGDGVQDAVIVARAKNAFGGQIPYNYRVIDPYFAAFGYGNPMITAGMASEYPDGNYMVLVIHGVGEEGWRATKPKAKFVMINLPFNTISVAPMPIEMKKKVKELAVIVLEEDGTNQSSLVAWDGKKYRWRDMGGPGY
jgi:hypothetical protein